MSPVEADPGSDDFVQPGKKLKIAILILVLAFFSLLPFLYMTVKSVHERQQQDSIKNADIVTENINKHLENLTEEISHAATRLAVSRRADTVASDNPGISESQLPKEIGDSLKVRFFALRKAVLDRNASPPFSFASLDMVHRSETSGDLIIEAIKVEKNWLVTVACPVRVDSNQSIQGTLFVYIEASKLVGNLEQLLSEDGIELVQSFDDLDWHTIASIGSIDQGQSIIESNLNLPIWHVRYHAARAEFLMAETQSLLLTLLVLALLIAAMLVMLFIRKNNDLPPESDAWPSGSFSTEASIASVKTSVPDKSGKMNTKPAESIDHIFRANDIRGIVSISLSPGLVKEIGLALGSEAIDRGQSEILVASDGRDSSPALTRMLTEGLRESGINVVSIGEVPTPLLYFACCNTSISSGVVVTGSHNPPEYNGFKMVIDGKPLMDKDIQKLYRRIKKKKFASGKGSFSELDITQDYISNALEGFLLQKELKVVVDCGNGIAGTIAPKLYEAIGYKVIPLYCEVDGSFPNHPPDPTIPVNLEDLIMTVRKEGADLGLALDGDGDRVIVVTKEGQIVWPDQMLMLLVNDILPENPGRNVVYDVKCSRQLAQLIEQKDGHGLMTKSGHSYLKSKMTESDAILGGEFSGHICIADKWFGFDDGIYAGARLLDIVARSDRTLEQMLKDFPESVSTPEILVRLDEETKFKIVTKFKKVVRGTKAATLTDLDGVRLDFPEGWGLVRASNTSPAITLRFEADSLENLRKIRRFFKTKLQDINPAVNF